MDPSCLLKPHKTLALEKAADFGLLSAAGTASCRAAATAEKHTGMLSFPTNCDCRWIVILMRSYRPQAT